MKRYVFDIEANGLLDTVSELHCITSYEIESQTWRQSSSRDKQDMRDHIRELEQADELIGHNIIGYDLPAIKKLYRFQPVGKMTDTLVLCRVLWTNLTDTDFPRVRKGELPKEHRGSQSLAAWGYRLGEMKGDYTGGWEALNDEMLEYNFQDVKVNLVLYEKILEKNLDPRCEELEHKFAQIMFLQEQNGFGFNVDNAYQLYALLAARRNDVHKELKEVFKPRWVVLEDKTVKRTRRVTIDKSRPHVKCEYTEGSRYAKIELREFNPASRMQIAERLQEFGWQPEEFTPSGQPKVDESSLKTVTHPSAKLLAESFLLDKRIGQLAEGDQAWLKLVTKEGKIHGRINTNGAVTGRCTHSKPNIAQVPSVGAPYGEDCRKLFGPTRKGWVLVGADLSGLELRCLAHFMAKYDGGAYGKDLLEGDVHTSNQKAAGLPTRNNAKTFIYAFLYGAGDAKIGSIVEPNASPTRQRSIGKRLKSRFMTKVPALGKLVDRVKAQAKKGYLKGLDGRKLFIRSDHAALNTLLQSAGGLISKMMTVLAYEELSARGYVFGKDYAFVAHIHDELQTECREEIADEIGNVLVHSMQRAGEVFGFRMPITGEYKVGSNWAETH